MEHELDKLYDEWYEVILEVPVLMNQPTEKSTFLLNNVSTVLLTHKSQWAKRTVAGRVVCPFLYIIKQNSGTSNHHYFFMQANFAYDMQHI